MPPMTRYQSPPEVVHHLYRHPGDLLPYCGTYPGRDPESGDFAAGHDRDTLLEFMGAGMTCCAVCLSPAALGDARTLGEVPAFDDEFIDTDDEEEWARYHQGG